MGGGGGGGFSFVKKKEYRKIRNCPCTVFSRLIKQGRRSRGTGGGGL